MKTLVSVLDVNRHQPSYRTPRSTSESRDTGVSRRHIVENHRSKGSRHFTLATIVILDLRNNTPDSFGFPSTVRTEEKPFG